MTSLILYRGQIRIHLSRDVIVISRDTAMSREQGAVTYERSVTSHGNGDILAKSVMSIELDV